MLAQDNSYYIENKKEFEKLMKELIDIDSERFNFQSYEFIKNMEKEIEDQKKQLAQYENFFSLLQKLTPRPFSMHDRIGDSTY